MPQITRIRKLLKFGHVVSPHDAMLALYMLSSCVCLSVRLSAFSQS